MKYNFDLDRNVETIEIEQYPISNKKSDMIINLFRENIKEITYAFELLENTNKETKEYILRCQIVSLMSAVDKYIHDIIKYGIIEIFNKSREKTKEYEQFTINMEIVERAIKNLESIDWLEDGILLTNKYKTFMQYGRIMKSLEIIIDKKKLQNIHKNIGTSKKSLENEINNIYKRRNIIAHQSDICDETNSKNDIDYDYVQKSLDLISNFIENIHNIIIMG